MMQTASLDSTNRLFYLRSAATHYQKALQFNNTNGLDGFRYAVALGGVRMKLRELPNAVEAYRTASRLAPPAERWTCEEMLARLQADLNDRTSARAHIQRAIELAPVNKLETLRKLQAEIGASVSR